jgi:hypothetical protein
MRTVLITALSTCAQAAADGEYLEVADSPEPDAATPKAASPTVGRIVVGPWGVNEKGPKIVPFPHKE